MKKLYKYNDFPPYGLHDMRVSKMEIVGKSLKLFFENGYVEAKEPYLQVDGNITIESIDTDFCFAHLLSKNGRFGDFRGEKLELADFLEKYKNFSFEIVDELYGYNQVRYSGYMILPNRNDLIELDISLYFEGNIVYETIEE